MRNDRNRQEEIQELKARVKEIKGRLAALEFRIGSAGTGGRGSMQLEWKAFVDTKRCVGCGACEPACPTEAISIDEQAHIDTGRCIGCGRCVQECPEGALSLQPVRAPEQHHRPFENRIQHVG